MRGHEICHTDNTRRFIPGADAIGLVEQKAADLQEQINAFRD